MRATRFLAAALAAVVVGLAHAETVTLSGVKYEDTVDVKGSKLVLNGAGIRYKAVFKVYTAGLYLQKKVGTPEEVLAMPGAKRMSVVMLRDIDSSELGKLFARGMEDNMDRAQFSKLIPGVLRMSQLFSDIKGLKSGEGFNLDWIPGTGAVVTVKGVQQGEPFKEPEFFNAILRIWLGHAPADWRLKESLLGKQPG